ncbi:MAG: response regulator [Proteobacteria bacterium]|nr:response regulator [Pseudomonadota bacterium]MBU1586288.1 response regulator [Pseudomonadota bacterium]MBU2453184.1 response regulator [Pseudomonadota bacterium]MBU2630785.1 response regulator [Pseudomonadota bacterium]
MKAFSLIAILLAFLSGGNNVYAPPHMPVAEKGIIDFTDWSFQDEGFVYLNGEWEFYWNKLLSPGESEDPKQKLYRNILDNWKHKDKYGHATYRLKIKIKEAERYAIYVPIIQIAHKLWIDDVLIGENGTVGTNRDSEIPEIRNYVEELYLTEGVHNITLHVSSYRMNNGGVRLPISFGKYKDIQSYRELKIFIEAMVLGLVGFMTISHFYLFWLNKKDYSNIHFIVICICTFLYFFLRSERFLFSLFFINLDWWILFKVGFITTYSVGPTFFIFNHSLYPTKYSEILLRPVKIIWGIFIACVLFLPAFIYVGLLSYYKLFIIIIFASIFMQTATAVKMKMKGSIVALSGVIVFTIGLAGEIIYDNRISSVSIFVPSYLFFLLTQSFLTSIKSSEAYKALAKSRAEISNQNIELNRLSSLKDEFLSNTTHELKTPLHGIMGIADALKDGIAGELNKETKSNLSIIINSAQRLSLLVNDILDAQRLKNQDIELNLTSFDLNRVVSVVVSVSQPLLKNKPVELINSINPDTFFVHADSNRLYQIIQNFVSNACKFTESGSIEISATKKKDMIHIAVTDTGIGISTKDQRRIYKRFEQVEHMVTGSGLGLSISKSLVELHGGSVFLESVFGKGSRFGFTMPSGSKTIQNESMQLPRMLNYTNEAQVISEIAPELHGQQILVVDDEPLNLKVVTDYLTMAKYKVHQCNSGQGAIEYLKDHKPDLILLDVMMPEIDGFTVCKDIREKYSHFEMPVIFITAKNQVTDLVQGFSLGGNDYLTKPFTKEELLARVRSQFATSKAKDRLINLRDFANKTCSFKNVDKLTKEVFTYVTADPIVEMAATFLNERLVKCTNSNKKECIKVFDQWRSNGIVKNGFIILNLKEINNFIIIIKTQVDVSPVDIEYFKNLEAQAEIIIKGFRRLVSDIDFIKDIFTIASLKNHIRFIRSKDKVAFLYEDKNDDSISLNSSLKTIECFFHKDLIRVNRSCLINPNKIVKINKDYKNRKKYLVNVDGEKISVSTKIIDVMVNNGYAQIEE